MPQAWHLSTTFDERNASRTRHLPTSSKLTRMLILLYTPKPAPPAGGINWDAWTAIGTLLLAVVTFATLIYAVIATTQERRQAKRDREAADARLIAEREAGDKRLQEERDHATELRRRERQIDNLAVLIARVAEIQAIAAKVPGTFLRVGRPSFSGRPLTEPEELGPISSLRHGPWTEAAMLGTGKAATEAARRYRALVRLVDEAADTKPFP